MAESIEVARAYVTLVPSLKGAQQEITKELVPAAEKSADEAGKKAGSKFSEKFGSALSATAKGVGKVVAGGMAAIVTAATTATTALIHGTSELASYGDEIDKASQKMGLSAQAYQEWDAILQHSGSSISALTPSLKTLTNAVINNSDAFQQLGISEEEVATLSKEDLFGKVITGLQGMEEGADRTAIATALLGKGAQELGPLLNTSAEDTEAMRQKVHELGGVLSDEAVKNSAAFQDSLQDMKTALTGVKNSILQQALPGLTSLMDGFTGLITGEKDARQKLSKGIKDLSKTIKKIVKDIVTAISSLLPDLISLIVEALPEFLEMGADIIQNLLDGIIGALPTLLQALPGMISTVLSMFTQIAQTVITALPQIIQTILEILPQILPEIISALINLITLVLNNITSIIQPIIMALPDIIMSVVNALIENLPILIDGIVNLITGLISMLPTILPVLIEAGIEIFMMIVENIDQIITPLVDAIPEILGTIFDVIIDLIPTLFELIIENLPKIIAGIVKVNLAIIKKIPQLLKSIWNAITKFFSTVWDSWIKPAAEKVGSFFSEIWKGIKKVALTAARFLMMNVAQPIALAFATAWDSIRYAAEVVWWALKKGFSTVINAIIDVINGMIDGINWALGWTGVNIDKLGKVTVESFDDIGKKSNESADAVKKSFEGMDSWFEKELTEPVEESLTTMNKNTKKSITEILKGHNGLESEWTNVMNGLNKITGGKLSTPTIDKPHLSISPKGWKMSDILTKGTVPKINIEWYAKAMNKGMLLDGATIFGMMGDKLLGGGETGQEVVVGSKSLMGMIQGAVSRGITTPNYSVNKNYTGNNINIIVNGAEGQDVEQLADIVLEKLQAAVTQKEVVYA